MQLVEWHHRPTEEAYLFNPAFCSALICEFVNEYQKAKGLGASYVLPFCALPVALHEKSREALPGTAITSMYTWIERNSNALIGYQKRAATLTPVAREAIRFGLDREALIIVNGNLEVGATKVSFTPKFLSELTYDARRCVLAARFLGRWFAKAGTASTILASWGIRP